MPICAPRGARSRLKALSDLRGLLTRDDSCGWHCQNEVMASSTGTTKPDATCLAAVDLARAAAEETAGVIGVGDYLGAQAEDTRVVSHFFACPHPGYQRLALVGDGCASRRVPAS